MDGCTADTICFLHMLSYVCVRSKAWLAAPAGLHAYSGEALTSPACHDCGCASSFRAHFWPMSYGENIGHQRYACVCVCMCMCVLLLCGTTLTARLVCCCVAAWSAAFVWICCQRTHAACCAPACTSFARCVWTSCCQQTQSVLCVAPPSQGMM